MNVGSVKGGEEKVFRGWEKGGGVGNYRVGGARNGRGGQWGEDWSVGRWGDIFVPT